MPPEPPVRTERPQDRIDRFLNIVAGISRAFGLLAAGMILLSALIVCQMVFARYVLGQSSYWQTEFVTYLLIGATFLGSPYVLLTRGHVNVELVPSFLNDDNRIVLATVANAVAFAFCAVVAWTGFDLWREAWAGNWLSETIWGPPLWIPYLALPVGMSLLCLQYAAQTLGILTGREKPFEEAASSFVKEAEQP
jgi:TRAP-type C4-dicarboxylate transport system permease small subunit